MGKATTLSPLPWGKKSVIVDKMDLWMDDPLKTGRGMEGGGGLLNGLIVTS